MAQRTRGQENGQTLIWAGLALALALVLMVAVAIEGGHLYQERRHMQNAADAGALAGARQLCLGTAVPEAEAVAGQYATTGNTALWATPIGSAADLSMSVTAVESTTLIFSGLLGSQTTVAAYAKATCQIPSAGCGNFPITIRESKFRDQGCDTPIVISVDEQECDNTLYQCDSFFKGGTTPQRGWWEPAQIQGCGEGNMQSAFWGSYSNYQVTVGSCISGKSGTTGGAINGEPNKCPGGSLIAWLNPSCNTNHIVQLPLYDSQGSDGNSPCTQHGTGCQDSYHVSGWGCLEITGYTDKYTIEPRSGAPKGTKEIKNVKAILATIKCDCTIACAQGGGNGDPKQVRIPILQPNP